MVFIVAIACISFGLPDILLGAQNRTRRQSDTADRTTQQYHAQPILTAANETSRETSNAPEASKNNKTVNDGNVERWRTLPSDEKKELRKRMDQWRNLSPKEQDKYRRRHEKLQEMPPGQRKKVDQELEKWDTLKPTEKEEIRRLFEE